MPVEPGNNLIADWNATDGGNNPDGTETRREGDDQIRGIKGTIKRNFPNLTNGGTVNASETELNILVGIATTEKVVTLPVGAIMYFEAPTTPGSGWVKKTDSAYDDVALRVVTGTPGTGGTYAFSAVFADLGEGASPGVGNHTLVEAEIPQHNHGDGAHTHEAADRTGSPGSQRILDYSTGQQQSGSVGVNIATASGFLDNYGGASPAHAHTADLKVKYRDVYAAEFQGY